MTVSPFASQVKIDAALTALGADLIGQTEQQLLQQLVVAAATASGGGGGGGGAVTSVNGQTGVVVLDPEDIGLTLPISISNGGTGSTTAGAARLALGVDEVIPAVAQVVKLNVTSSASTGWAGQYIDIDASPQIYRFWFSIDGTGTAPSTPSGGSLIEVALSEFDSISDVITDLVSLLGGYSGAFTISNTDSSSFRLTNTTAGLAPATNSSCSGVSFETITSGAAPSARLAAADGSALTDIIASTIPTPTSGSLGGVYASATPGYYVDGLDSAGNLLYSPLSASIPDVRIYTANATWDNPSPSTARRVYVRLVGGGGGGGSGRKGVAGVNRFGGGGGAAGAVTEFWTLTTELASTRPVTVGAGGTGGAAVSADTTNGNSGTAGGSTTFAGLTAVGGEFGVGGGASTGTAGAAVANSCVAGVSSASNGAGGAGGAVAGAAGTTVNPALPTGGGGGGGLDASNTNRAGGAGGSIGTAGGITVLAGGTAGTSGGGAGGAGNAGRGSGTGGGGGGSNGAGAGGAGGNGGGFGSGGGGGAAGTNSVGNSGAGGNGAQGYALIITY